MAGDGREQIAARDGAKAAGRGRAALPFGPPGPLRTLAGRLGAPGLALTATFEREIDAGRGFLWLPVAFGCGILDLFRLAGGAVGTGACGGSRRPCRCGVAGALAHTGIPAAGGGELRRLRRAHRQASNRLGGSAGHGARGDGDGAWLDRSARGSPGARRRASICASTTCRTRAAARCRGWCASRCAARPTPCRSAMQ